ncbi:hypothetical protein [Candidatus Poriferisodalis sp.]|uniref:hypothetical protein n=1 Tax=Candidatus Poriferisodalis sp. TaxID=3101277 RepID=UPI003D0A3D42
MLVTDHRGNTDPVTSQGFADIAHRRDTAIVAPRRGEGVDWEYLQRMQEWVRCLQGQPPP